MARTCAILGIKLEWPISESWTVCYVVTATTRGWQGCVRLHAVVVRSHLTIDLTKCLYQIIVGESS